MVILINFMITLTSSWGSSWLLWLSGPIWLSTIGFAVVELIEDRKDKKKNRQAFPTDTPIPPVGTKRAAAASRIMLLLLLPVVGYAVGTHRQSKQDAKLVTERYAKYDAEHAAWLERSKLWAEDYKKWKATHPQEKINARRSVSASTSTRAATYTATYGANEPNTSWRQSGP